ncbi:hypothetical protein SF23_16335, partial [Streptomyces sp. MBRL 10]
MPQDTWGTLPELSEGMPMRDSHRGEAERLLVRAVDEAVRRGSGGPDATGTGVERAVLLARGRELLDS